MITENYEDILRQQLGNIVEPEQQNTGITTINETKQTRGGFNEILYNDIDVSILPAAKFYPKGTRIKIKPATVKEVQHFSTIDDSNTIFSLPDIIDKTNYVLNSCVKIVYPDNSVGTYLDLFDLDRFFMIYMIREATFQNGKILGHEVKCKCGEKVKVELRPQYLRFYKEDEKLAKYYTSDGFYTIPTEKFGIIKVAPPRIRVNTAFNEYIKEQKDKDSYNMSFLKIIPFFLENVNNITNEGIEQKLVEFENMSIEEFTFKNSIVSKMTKMGVEKAVSTCQACGEEVSTLSTFPERPSMFFVDDDAFDAYTL